MTRALRGGLFYAMLFLSTLVWSLAGIVGGLVRAGHGWFDRVHRSWSGWILWAAGVTVRVEGVEHSRPGRAQILIANHRSLFDIWALMAAVPASLRFVAKMELARIPLFAAACRAAGHVFIDRSRPAEAGEIIRRAAERMRREGLTLVMFPEGTRSRDGDLGRFRRGAFALAIETGADLIPVGILGSGHVFPPGSRVPRPGLIRLRLAPPVPLAGLEPGDRDDLVERVHATVSGLLAEGASAGSGPPP